MKTIKNNLRVLSYFYRFVPVWVFSAVFQIIASVVLSVSKILLIKEAIQLVIDGAEIEILFRSLLLFVIVIIVTSFFRTFYTSYVSVRYRVVFLKKMQQMMFSKVKNIDMESFDNPGFYDNYHRALWESIFRSLRVFDELVRFLTSLISSIAIGAIIIISDPILIVIILISSLINIFVVNKVNKNWYEWSKETEPDRRMYYYINRTFYRQKFAGEIKTTPISDLLTKKYQEAAEIINSKYAKTHKKVLFLRTFYNVSKGFIEQGASYAYLGYRLWKGIILISEFTATVNATLQFSANFMESIQFLTTLKDSSYYIDDFLWFLEYEPKVEEQKGISIPGFSQLDLEELGFKYPEADLFSLQKIFFHLKEGEKIAIVGPNGGGKTTLTKLLLHFYRPTEGMIKFNKHSYDEMDSTNIRSKYAVVFQDFQIYALTIGENVLMRKLLDEADEDRVWEALEMVGMKEKVAALPEGINTQVTREFNRNGAVFSGGEIQRLAIARVFASEAQIYILDEPTSSLDPLSEEKINRLIIQNSKKTMIIIAHRLSTVVDTNRIYLIDRGRIVEEGTHEELMSLKGLYAKMFQTQKSLYQKQE